MMNRRMSLLAAGLVLALKSQGAASSPALRVRAIHIEEAVLAWQDGGRNVGYVLERKSGDGSWAAVASLAPGKLTFRDRGLTPDTAYVYRLILATVLTTKVFRGGDRAGRFVVSLEDGVKLSLVATDGGDGNGNDHAIWGSPALIKKDGTRVPLARLKAASVKVGWDQPQEPRAIKIGGKEYGDSIWAHAPSELMYDLGPEYVRFEAWVGVDDQQEEKGSVAFKASVMTNRVSEEILVHTKSLVSSAGHKTYYVDSKKGGDGNNGTSPRTPWKTLQRVNNVKFAPGDHILFKSGTRYQGQLKPHGSGREGAPIVVDRYGGKKYPRIDGEGKFKSTVYLRNVEYWEVRNLEVTNTGKTRAPHRCGVLVELRDFGVAHHIHLQGLYIHDVNGSNVKDAGGGYGILWSNGGSEVASFFDGLLIENCHLVRCDRNGICGQGYWDRDNWHPSRDVVIRGNLLEDIGGDCIVPIGVDGCLIEHNVVRGGRMRARDYAAGIWPWSCDNTLIQFNEVSGMKGTKDGQGFDSDYNCRNTVFQYNYSHDNDGGFMLICDAGKKEKYSIGNIGTVIRYNISQNDGARIFQIGGPVKDVEIYNNVFYTGPNLEVLGIFHNSWNGWSDGVRFSNNIFIAEGKVKHEFGQSTNNAYASNVFYGNHRNLPKDPKARTTDPQLANPGSGGDGLGSLAGYRLTKDSPCVRAGVPVPNHGKRDFWGNGLPQGGVHPDIGAHQRGWSKD